MVCLVVSGFISGKEMLDPWCGSMVLGLLVLGAVQEGKD